MKKPEIKMTVTKEDKGFSAFTNYGENFIATSGETWQELEEMVVEAVNLAFENLGIQYSINEISMEYEEEIVA